MPDDVACGRSNQLIELIEDYRHRYSGVMRTELEVHVLPAGHDEAAGSHIKTEIVIDGVGHCDPAKQPV